MKIVWKLVILCMCLAISNAFFLSQANACDIAVVSPKASASGKPLLWKSRDYKMRWSQEVRYSTGTEDTGGSVTLSGQMGLSGGVNEAGFAITNTVVYRNSPLRSSFLNGNLELMSAALEKCTSIGDLDNYLFTWHEDPENNPKVISGNFMAIDSNGGAVLYEITSGNSTKLSTYYSKLKINRIDASTGFVTNEEGELIGNNGDVGYITNFNTGQKHKVLNSDRELLTDRFTLDTTYDDRKVIVDRHSGEVIDNGENFIGVLNRCNSNFWRSLNDDTPKEDRARSLLHSLANEGNLTYKTFIQNITKDANVENYNLEEYDNLTRVVAPEPAQRPVYHTISRYCTNAAFVVNGVTPQEDPRLATMWTILGEPSVGVAVPYFPAAEKVPSLAKDEDRTRFTKRPVDRNATCFLNIATVDKELELYENNKPSTGFDMSTSQILDILFEEIIPTVDQKFPSIDINLSQEEIMFKLKMELGFNIFDWSAEELRDVFFNQIIPNSNLSKENVWAEFERQLGNWVQEYEAQMLANSDMDRTINYPGLLVTQEWTMPLENKVMQEADNFIQGMKEDPGRRITQENLYSFSKYCTKYVYNNYQNRTYKYMDWDFESPWNDYDSIHDFWFDFWF